MSFKIKTTARFAVPITTIYELRDIEIDVDDGTDPAEVDDDFVRGSLDWMLNDGEIEPTNGLYYSESCDDDCEIAEIVSFKLIIPPKFVDPLQEQLF